MARIRIDKPIRAALLDALIGAGIAPTTPEGVSILQPDGDGAGGWLTVPDAHAGAAGTIVATHDAAALDAVEAARAAEDADDLAGFRDIYQAIRQRAATFRQDAATMPATLTAAQVRGRLIQIEDGLADLADIVARLGRYVGRRAPPDG